MKRYLKLSMLAAICAVGVAGAAIAGITTPEPKPATLVDYLNGENVSFLIVNTGPNARLTTFGWKDAAVGCTTIRKIGFNVSNIRNYSSEDRIETNAVCQN